MKRIEGGTIMSGREYFKKNVTPEYYKHEKQVKKWEKSVRQSALKDKALHSKQK